MIRSEVVPDAYLCAKRVTCKSLPRYLIIAKNAQPLIWLLEKQEGGFQWKKKINHSLSNYIFFKTQGSVVIDTVCNHVLDIYLGM